MPFQSLTSRFGVRRASVLLGVVWGLWHLPVVDSLGAASPHRTAWLGFFLAVVLVLSGLRVIISWAAARTGTILIAQLIHVSSTGCLVMLGPSGVTPAKEALKYGVYGFLLWLVAAWILRYRPPAPITFFPKP